eukprot:CAMPEP_0174348612 /NCGR_PEP_ID=MMETSP0811_2-20130205/5150_1 /TAXON_ID=73025 ORGANISM="Eutreptiella gymnastica-like, Strain CCMP1594" /NCGR_SAMPLE_ID=MMETSP0811_2 /ASSEMBLY_ACC=CAM_ASM_000667 /LENGTH=78 /DNA_ID=CAMNT_0015475325 /DNA_START=327 /DNA_END=559 /DNA_ORIENTATION=+
MPQCLALPQCGSWLYQRSGLYWIRRTSGAAGVGGMDWRLRPYPRETSDGGLQHTGVAAGALPHWAMVNTVRLQYGGHG